MLRVLIFGFSNPMTGRGSDPQWFSLKMTRRFSPIDFGIQVLVGICRSKVTTTAVILCLLRSSWTKSKLKVRYEGLALDPGQADRPNASTLGSTKLRGL